VDRIMAGPLKPTCWSSFQKRRFTTIIGKRAFAYALEA
jgi:hypothetical protein